MTNVFLEENNQVKSLSTRQCKNLCPKNTKSSFQLIHIENHIKTNSNCSRYERNSPTISTWKPINNCKDNSNSTTEIVKIKPNTCRPPENILKVKSTTPMLRYVRTNARFDSDRCHPNVITTFKQVWIHFQIFNTKLNKIKQLPFSPTGFDLQLSLSTLKHKLNRNFHI